MVAPDWGERKCALTCLSLCGKGQITSSLRGRATGWPIRGIYVSAVVFQRFSEWYRRRLVGYDEIGDISSILLCDERLNIWLCCPAMCTTSLAPARIPMFLYQNYVINTLESSESIILFIHRRTRNLYSMDTLWVLIKSYAFICQDISAASVVSPLFIKWT